MVDDLLDVSRLDRGSITLRNAPTDMVALINDCLAEFRLKAVDRKFIFKKPEQAVELDVDQVRIQQVMFNLFDNAVKYTPEDQPIEVAMSVQPQFVRISVIDHGAGISPEQQVDLFKPFHRGTTDREERASGLGLGLVVCEGIVKLHGGHIGFTSEMGVGSTFYFDLPRGLSEKENTDR